MRMIGIDLGGTNVKAGLVDQTGAILHRCRRSTDRAGGGDAICDQVIDCCQTLCREAGLTPADLDGVGVATPGWIDACTGVVYSSANLPFDRYPLADELAGRLGCPVKVENDANCAALGEVIFGAAKGEHNVLVITVGTGIGSGVVHDGKLISGPGAAELGHMLLKLGGRLCGCGRRGCCEAYSSASALIARATEAAAEHPESRLNDGSITGEAVFSAAAAGDETANMMLEGYFSDFAEMLMSSVNIFRPALILIGGGVAGAGEAFFGPVRACFDAVARGNVYGINMPPVRPAKLGNDAGILGAAALQVPAIQ